MAPVLEKEGQLFRIDIRNEDLEKVTGGAGTDGYNVKDEFTLCLREVEPSKMSAIAAVKEIKGIGLKEAKALVDTLPSLIGVYSTEEQAVAVKCRLESTGCTVEVSCAFISQCRDNNGGFYFGGGNQG